MTSAVQEYSASKRRGIRIKLHDKIGALTFLSKREGLDKPEELIEEQENDGFIEALNNKAKEVWKDEK